MIRPPALGAGARVALVAPAGPLAAEAVDRAVARVRACGWEPLLGAHARGRLGYLSGSDEERAADLNQALRSADTDAIWCLRGGYGTMRILERLDWDALRARPKPLIGFSDNTALHLAVQRLDVISFHGPHAGAAELDARAERLLAALLAEPATPVVLAAAGEDTPAAETLVGGRAEGRLLGGNLSIIAATIGTPYAIRAESAVLLLEEVGEPPYRVDRLLSQLKLAGVLDAAAGVAVGAFTGCDDDDVSAAEVVRDRLVGLRVPVAAGFPFGHVPQSWTLPLGVRARLDANAGTLELLEPAVSPRP